MIRFLAIDSSLSNTGILKGYIDKDGDILPNSIALCETVKSKHKQVRASSDTIQRCRKTYNFLDEIIKEHKPQVIFVETPSGSQMASGMKSYGATCQLIATLKPEPLELTPDEVKMGSVGNKTASKMDIIKWAMKMYPNLEWQINKSTRKPKAKNEHMADAVAIAHAGIQLDEFKRLLSIINE